MQAYWVTINGENFLVEMAGSAGKYGFFAHRCVSAESPEAAELLAVQSLREDERLRELVKNRPDDPPTMELESLHELEAIDPNCPSGVIWYEMNPKRWWQIWKRG